MPNIFVLVADDAGWRDFGVYGSSLVKTPNIDAIANSGYIEMPRRIINSPSGYELLRLKNQHTLTKEQRLIFKLPKPRVELYDLKNDPWEINNLASKPEYLEIANKLARKLNRWKKRTGDFPPQYRRRADVMDRLTGIRIKDSNPPPPIQNNIDLDSLQKSAAKYKRNNNLKMQ